MHIDLGIQEFDYQGYMPPDDDPQTWEDDPEQKKVTAKKHGAGKNNTQEKTL